MISFTTLLRWGIVAFMLAATWLIVRPFIGPTLLASVLVISTWPLHDLVAKKIHRKGLRATILISGWLVVLVGPLSWLLYMVSNNAVGWISEIKKYLGTRRLELPKFIVDLPWIGAPIKNYWHQLTHNQDELLNIFNKLVGPLSDKGWDGVTTFLNSTVQLLFVLFIAWFLYFDGLRIAAWLFKIAQRMAPDLGKVLLTQSMITVRAVMLGLMGSALGQSLCMAIGLWIAGVPQIGLLSAATFFLSLLPGGPLLVWGGAAVWLYLEQSYGSMIFMLCWGVLVVSSVDNFLKPLIMSKGTDLSLLLVTLGVFGGALAFGFIGLFLGPVILGLVSTLLDIWLEQDIVENDKPPSENSTLKK